MGAPQKFGWVEEGTPRIYQHPNTWAVEKTTGPERLIIAPSGQHVSLVLDLLSTMPEPFGILYVLVVPRGDEKPGRYQTPTPTSRYEAQQFLSRFKTFFEQDGRHNIWIASTAGSNSDQLVYDRHNVIYAYGDLQAFERVLVNRGLSRAESVSYPCPHVHWYNEEFDADARELLHRYQWKWFPLQDEDWT